nr:hypothetical protein [Saprospiraceae bacterium]
MKKVIISIFLWGVLSTWLTAQNFEGIIVYERTTDGGSLALKTYYFGDQKIRTDTRFIFEDHHMDYIAIFDFKNYTNKYFSDSGHGPFRPIEITKNNIELMEVHPDSIKTFLGFDCYLIEIEFEVGPFSTFMTQSRYHAKDLQFSVPEEWMLDYIQIISGDDGIALFVETDISNVDPELAMFLPKSSFTYNAIKVIPMKLPEDLFHFEELLGRQN